MDAYRIFRQHIPYKHIMAKFMLFLPKTTIKFKGKYHILGILSALEMG